MKYSKSKKKNLNLNLYYCKSLIIIPDYFHHKVDTYFIAFLTNIVKRTKNPMLETILM